MFEECMKRKCVTITITEDQTYEFDESFTFHLNSSTNVSSHFNFGSVEGVIHIIDNDGEKCILIYWCESVLQLSSESRNETI